MYQTINQYQFCQAFEDAGRGSQFSYDGLNALFGYFEEMQNGTEIELDVIALCCEFSEYETAIEIASNYTNQEFTEDEALEYLQDHSIVIPFDGGIIIQDW